MLDYCYYNNQKIYQIYSKVMKTKIYFINIKELINLKYLNSLYFYNNKKIQKLKNNHQKKLSIAAAVLTNACSELYSFNVRNIYISETGKPFIYNSPYHLSISHAGNFACCGISKNEIGIDIEKVFSLDYQSIVKYHFSKDEQVFISKISETDRQKIFFDLWVLKESFLKNVGLGLSVPLNSFNFRVLNKKCSLFTVIQRVNKKHYYSELFDFSEESGYSLACCIED